MLKRNRLRWFRHAKGAELYIGHILDLEMEGKKSRCHPKKCWLDAIKDGLRQWNLQA